MSTKEDYVICRCEEITLQEIKEAKKNGAITPQEIKMVTRAGMGMCQGRICRSLLEKFTSEDKEGFCTPPSKLTIHNPVRPVPLGMVISRED